MVTPTFRRKQPPLRTLAAALCLAALPGHAAADDLANRAFQLKYDASGITSLKRTGDVADTDYIAANGALGRLIVRYRTSPHSDWKEFRDLLAGPRGANASEIAHPGRPAAGDGVAGVRQRRAGRCRHPRFERRHRAADRCGRRQRGRAGNCGTSDRCPDLHLDAVTRRDPVGAVHVSGGGNHRAR
jgi:hypothetical protein